VRLERRRLPLATVAKLGPGSWLALGLRPLATLATLNGTFTER
jgi:hypothetical protein